MVVIDPTTPILNIPAYYTTPSTNLLNTTFTHDYEVGSFARFQHPLTVFTLHDDPSLHGLSHVDIRVTLDARGVTSPALLIDENALSPTHAIWWILDTEASKRLTAAHPDHTITYPATEPFTLWQLLLTTQHFDIEYRASSVLGQQFPELLELAGHYPPYDPHDPQIPPFSLGKDFADKSQAGFVEKAGLRAEYAEVDWTADQAIIAARFKRLMRHPPLILYVVKLTADVAGREGLVSDWALPSPAPEEGDPLPAPGMVFSFSQRFDWDSPKWGPEPVPGSAGAVGEGSAAGNETAELLVQESLACGSTVGRVNGIVQGVGDAKELDIAQRCGAARNGSGNVLQLAAGPGSWVGGGVDVI